VPAAHFDGRVGYSLGWKAEEPLDEEMLAKKPKKPEEPGEVPGEMEAKRPAEVPPGEEPPPEVAMAEVPPEEAAREMPPGEETAEVPPEETAREVPPAEEVPEVPPEETAPEPKVASIFPEPIPTGRQEELPPAQEVREVGGRFQVARVDFMVDAPKALSPEQPTEYVDTDSEPALTSLAKENLRAQKGAMLAKLRETRGGLLIVGFSDKCYDGPPYLGTQYNRELTTRRVKAVVRYLRSIMGNELEGVSIRLMPMGRRCANPLCRCSTPEMTPCAKDRRVEIYVETGAEESFQCPEGDYWLVP